MTGSKTEKNGGPARGYAAGMAWIMNRVTVAGCLAMVFMYATIGAQRTEFVRSLGATKFHFGVIGAIPPFMLGLQFISATDSGRARSFLLECQVRCSPGGCC